MVRMTMIERACKRRLYVDINVLSGRYVPSLTIDYYPLKIRIDSAIAIYKTLFVTLRLQNMRLPRRFYLGSLTSTMETISVL